MGQLIFELWYYNAMLPNNGGIKRRPVLIIGDDGENGLSIVDIHYCLVSSSSQKGTFDVTIDAITAQNLGLSRESIIKTTKIYTGTRNLLNGKIADLPEALKKEFCEKYKHYLDNPVITDDLKELNIPSLADILPEENRIKKEFIDKWYALDNLTKTITELHEKFLQEGNENAGLTRPYS